MSLLFELQMTENIDEDDLLIVIVDRVNIWQQSNNQCLALVFALFYLVLLWGICGGNTNTHFLTLHTLKPGKGNSFDKRTKSNRIQHLTVSPVYLYPEIFGFESCSNVFLPLIWRTVACLSVWKVHMTLCCLDRRRYEGIIWMHWSIQFTSTVTFIQSLPVFV